MNGVHCQIKHDHHHRQRDLTDPVHLADPDQRQHPVQDAVGGVEDRRLPDQRCRNGCDQERGDQQRPDDSASQECPIQQQCEQQAEERRDQHDDDDQDDGVEGHPPELAVLRDCDVVLQSDELAGAGTNQVPRQRRVVQREQERDLRDGDHEDQRRQQRSPPAPPFGAAHAGVLGFPDLADSFGHCLLTGVGRCISGYGHHFSWYVRPTTSAYCCAWASASSTDFCPAIAALIC